MVAIRLLLSFLFENNKQFHLFLFFLVICALFFLRISRSLSISLFQRCDTNVFETACMLFQSSLLLFQVTFDRVLQTKLSAFRLEHFCNQPSKWEARVTQITDTVTSITITITITTTTYNIAATMTLLFQSIIHRHGYHRTLILYCKTSI